MSLPQNYLIATEQYSVDLEGWSKLAKRAQIKRIASKFARDCECDLQRVNAFSHCVYMWSSPKNSNFSQIGRIVWMHEEMCYRNCLYSVDLEVWSKLAKRAQIKGIASKFERDFECDLQRVNAFSHCVSLTRVLLPQIISCSDTKVFGFCCYGM